jgi:tRNA U55 pseudouridine synthase TruB
VPALDEASVRRCAASSGNPASASDVLGAQADGKRLYRLARAGIEVERAPPGADFASGLIGLVPIGSNRSRLQQGHLCPHLAEDIARALGRSATS